MSPIVNDCIKLSIDGQVEPQLVPKCLLQVSVRELHNSMVIPPEEGELKEAIDTDNNFIISDSILCRILPPPKKKMTYRYKVMCGCDCFISSKIMHFYLLTCRDHLLKHLKDRSHNAQNRKSGEISSRIFKSIIIQYNLMVLIFTIPLKTWPCQKCVPVTLNTMAYRTRNLCYIFVINVQVLS